MPSDLWCIVFFFSFSKEGHVLQETAQGRDASCAYLITDMWVAADNMAHF